MGLDKSKATSLPDAEFTILKSEAPKVITKSFGRDCDGTLTKEGGGMVFQGEVEVAVAADLDEFAVTLKDLGENEAVTYGISALSEAKVMTRAELARKDYPEGSISRTRQYFSYPSGQPGLLHGDYDPKGDGPPMTKVELRAALIEAVPGLADAEMLMWASASTHIHDSKTGEELKGPGGLRFWVMVEDASDIPRAGMAIYHRLWLAGHGTIHISADGRLLPYTLTDRMVYQPERLDFVSGAKCAAGLEQRRGAPELFPGKVKRLNSLVAIPDLTEDEQAKVDAAMDKAKEPVLAAAATVREKWRKDRGILQVDRAEKRAKRAAHAAGKEYREMTPTHREAAIAKEVEVVRRAAETLTLEPSFVIEAEIDGKVREVDVATILANPDIYDGALCRDPLEAGYDGHRLVGQIYCHNPALGFINSYAHGQQVFRMVHEDVEREVQQAVLKTMGEMLAELMKGGKLPPVGTPFMSLDSDIDPWLPADDETRYWRAVNRLQRTHVFKTSDGLVHDLTNLRNMRRGEKQDVVRKRYAAFSVVRTSETGQRTLVNPFDTWVKSEHKIEVVGARFRPAGQLVLCGEYSDDDGSTDVFMNTYRGLLVPPERVDEEATALVREYLIHLLPDEEEREWFYDWLARKYQRPETRNCSVLMVASARGGVGRGILYSMINTICKDQSDLVSAETLVGAGPSGGRNTHMADTLFVMCNEVGGIGFAERKKGAERIKENFDPYDTTIHIDQKYEPAYTERHCAATGLWATNNSNALHLTAEDRRLAILTNRDLPLRKAPDKLFERVTVEGMQDRMASELARLLRDRVVTREVTDAPQFEGRGEMIEAGFNSTDAAIQHVLETDERIAWKLRDFCVAVTHAKTGKHHVNYVEEGVMQATTELRGAKAELIGVARHPKKVAIGPNKSTANVLVRVDAMPVFLDASPVEREKMVDATGGVTLADVREVLEKVTK